MGSRTFVQCERCETIISCDVCVGTRWPFTSYHLKHIYGYCKKCNSILACRKCAKEDEEKETTGKGFPASLDEALEEGFKITGDDLGIINVLEKCVYTQVADGEHHVYGYRIRLEKEGLELEVPFTAYILICPPQFLYDKRKKKKPPSDSSYLKSLNIKPIRGRPLKQSIRSKQDDGDDDFLESMGVKA